MMDVQRLAATAVLRDGSKGRRRRFGGQAGLGCARHREGPRLRPKRWCPPGLRRLMSRDEKSQSSEAFKPGRDSLCTVRDTCAWTERSKRLASIRIGGFARDSIQACNRYLDRQGRESLRQCTRGQAAVCRPSHPPMPGVCVRLRTYPVGRWHLEAKE